MTTQTYAIDDTHGNQLTTDLQQHQAHDVAQRLADERAEAVYLYAVRLDAEGDMIPVDVGDATAYEEIEPRTVRCQCGHVTGVRCAWTGQGSHLVTVEWMPRDLRASHAAAGNAGAYPHNGAERLRVSADCADMIVEDEGGWATVIA